MAASFDRRDVVVGEVEVRPTRPDERRRWDALVDEASGTANLASRALSRR